MSAAALLYMVLVLALVWGGFGYCLVVQAREGRGRGDDSAGDSE